MRADLYTDGGARGNPGPGGAGIVLRDENGGLITCGGKFLGTVTNNIAEYEALVWGLEVAADHKVSKLHVFMDSELLVKQMNGVYRVKHPNMIPLYRRAQTLCSKFESVTVEHIRRAQNAEADQLANEAMDAKAAVGPACAQDASPQQGSLFD